MIETIAVFGATGRTGEPFIRQALEKYKVKVLVRDPDKLKFTNDNLSVIKGDILNLSDVHNTIKGTDAVVSLIGHDQGSPEHLQSQGIENQIKVMEELKIKRLISLTGGGVRDEEHDQPGFMDKVVPFVMKYLAGKMVRNALKDGRRHAEIIKASDLDWTIVRAPMLKNDPAKNKIKVGYVGTVPGFKLTREDLATFILKTVEQNKYIKDMPFVTNG